VSGDIESLLRSELAELADAAPPSINDPGLADLAIAGAGRIRRRRRISAAASGAGLLVLGAAVFVWQPWVAPDLNDGTIAADTSTSEAQSELDMEFVVEDESGVYQVLNEDGDYIPLGNQEPTSVYRLTDSYMYETESEVSLTSFDGTTGSDFEKSNAETYTKVNSDATQIALVSPNAEYTAEAYRLVDVTMTDATAEAADAPEINFTANYLLTLEDWSASTAVFTSDLTSTTGGDSGAYFFEEEFNWGLESVAAAGFESVAVVDTTDPNYVCVADLDAGVGLARAGEECGQVDSDVIQTELNAAAADDSAGEMAEAAIARYTGSDLYSIFGDYDLGEYEDRFYESGGMWTDPLGRWEMSGTHGEETWLLLDVTGEEPVLSELTPPKGVMMPVLSYV